MPTPAWVSACSTCVAMSDPPKRDAACWIRFAPATAGVAGAVGTGGRGAGAGAMLAAGAASAPTMPPPVVVGGGVADCAIGAPRPAPLLPQGLHMRSSRPALPVHRRIQARPVVGRVPGVGVDARVHD